MNFRRIITKRITDFTRYRDDTESGEHSAASLSQTGGFVDLEWRIFESSELLFSEFIKLYPEDGLVSEAYSYRVY